ncbi:hypothetical protein [Streptomyces sp. NRRL F-5727]|uniref:hypothetical protein n=1 Tax=Streptomyces sp. NRRL F-5727 TaxID=1463871 RepID=UPI00068ADE4B|nr:hypothetical protein [Streptomyces sp. NRRL F-5727]
MGDAHTSGSGGRPSGGGEPPSGPPPGPLSGSSPRPSRRRAWLLALVGVIVLAVGVAGLLVGTGAFGDGDGEKTPTPTLAPATAAGETSTAPTARPATTLPPGGDSADGLLPFGRAHRYEGGVEVTVSAPERFTPADSSAGHKAGNVAVKVDVTVRNDTGERFELVNVVVQGRDGEGREAVRVFDGQEGLLPLSGGLLPGRKAVAVYGFDVPPAAGETFEVEVSVGFTGDSAFWGGRLP